MIVIPDKLKDSPPEIKELNNFLVRTNGKELTSIHTPCYQPTMIKYHVDLKRLIGVEKYDMDSFFKNLTAQYMSSFKILQNDITSILVIGIIYYSRHKRYDIAESLYILLAIRFYTNRVSLHWKKYCKNDVWDLALRNLSQKHLFKVKNGVSNSIYYLAIIEYNKHKQKLSSSKITDKDVLDLVYALRHRIAQSVRSFANRYFDIEQGGNTSVEDSKEQTGELENVNQLANVMSERICTYSQIDKESLDESILKSRIKRDIATSIIAELSTIQFKDNVRFMIVLLFKVNNLKDICTKQSYMLRKIITNTMKVGGYSIKGELLKIADEMKNPLIKNLNKDQIVLLLASYITTYIRRKVC